MKKTAHVVISIASKEKIDNLVKITNKKIGGLVDDAIDFYNDYYIPSNVNEIFLEYFHSNPVLPFKSLLNILYIMSENYPGDSAKAFWTPFMYKGDPKLTNLQLFQSLETKLNATKVHAK